MTKKNHGTLGAFLAGVILLLATGAQAAEEFQITIKDHRFEPAELRVPSGQKIRIRVDNQDPTPEEFESHELHREKIIGGKSQAVIFLGPLKPGTYKYFGEFHQETAQGLIIAKEN